MRSLDGDAKNTHVQIWQFCTSPKPNQAYLADLSDAVGNDNLACADSAELSTQASYSFQEYPPSFETSSHYPRYLSFRDLFVSAVYVRP